MIGRPALAAAVIATCAAAASPALAAQARTSAVALVRGDPSDRLLREAALRLRAELVAAGFRVIDVERVPGDGRSEVESADGGDDAFATVAMNRVGLGAAADVWIGDRVTGKTVVRRIRVDGAPRAAAELAVRALELLRASLLEVAVAPAPGRDRPEPPRDVVAWARPRPAHGLLRDLAVGVGVGGVNGHRGVGLAVGPTLRVSYGTAAGPFARATIGAPLLAPDASDRAGRATIREQLATADLGWSSPTAPLGAHAWVSVGVFQLRVEGSAVAPYRATTDTVTSFLTGAGVGGTARLAERLAAFAEVTGTVLAPRPFVVIGGRDVGTVGAPSIGGALGLVIGI